MTKDQRVAEFKKLQHDIKINTYLMSILEWDGETVAPLNGGAARGEAMATLAGQVHDLTCSADAHRIVDALSAEKDLDEQTAFELKIFSRDLAESSAISSEEEQEYTRLVCEASDVWHAVKNTGDWDTFAPYIDKLVAMLRDRANKINPDADPYDVLLDLNERGLTSVEFDKFCDQVRSTVVPLVHAISAKGPQKRPAFMDAYMSEEAQLALGKDLIEMEGLDMNGVAVGLVEHPFSEGFANGDVRVATHIYPNDLTDNVFSMLHEGGHALYEQNVKPQYGYSCLYGGTSMGIHESQSRFMENVVGRSRAFMEPLLELLKKHAPEIFENVSADELYRGVNIAQPSLIRTAADELTYSLHIMVRYEIERMLFSGEATAKDVPALWAKFMKEYLGVEVPNNTLGCLQDTHWSGGSFGYFPSYALGSAYAAQFLAAMKADGVDFEGSLAKADFAPINAWLKEHVWQHGRALDGPEIVEAACKAPFDASYYCNYLAEKFSAIYDL